mmetsp:Transcript_38020/g.74293  ORF Transcript_38020/g.74293 Transcript_38020/m.74293 type:complete len:241 (+) Transcript_38020:900-1622(+)
MPATTLPLCVPCARALRRTTTARPRTVSRTRMGTFSSLTRASGRSARRTATSVTGRRLSRPLWPRPTARVTPSSSRRKMAARARSATMPTGTRRLGPRSLRGWRCWGTCPRRWRCSQRVRETRSASTRRAARLPSSACSGRMGRPWAARRGTCRITRGGCAPGTPRGVRGQRWGSTWHSCTRMGTRLARNRPSTRRWPSTAAPFSRSALRLSPRPTARRRSCRSCPGAGRRGTMRLAAGT